MAEGAAPAGEVGGGAPPEPPVALVIGASRGIGRACAEALAARGWRLALAARTLGPELQDTAQGITRRGGPPPLLLAMDVARPDQVAQGFRDLFTAQRRLDVLVHSAGIMAEAPLGLMPAATVEHLLAVNAAGPLHALQLAARLMARRGRGSVVLVGSAVGLQGAPGAVAYAASKAAVVGMVRAAAQELGPLGIRVNAVAPGLVDTALTAGLPPERRAALLARTALRRAATPEDVAAVVAFLAGEDSAFVTGQVLAVDGGLRL